MRGKGNDRFYREGQERNDLLFFRRDFLLILDLLLSAGRLQSGKVKDR